MKRIKLVATDLDGTLLTNERGLSATDLYSLEQLGGKQVVRVAATGRSMYKVMEVLPPGTPVDYIVFSSGGGIFDWNRNRILTCEKFDENLAEKLCAFLLTLNLNFFVYEPIPDNNRFQYHKGGADCPEFNDYLERHSGDYKHLDEKELPLKTGHMMAIIPNKGSLFEKIKSDLSQKFETIKVVRTTSPVNGQFIWFEIFPDTVSKGHGLKWLGEYLHILPQEMAGVGNDYNDLDMLDYVGFPFVLGNSPDELKAHYPHVANTNQESGFTEVVSRLEIL